LCNFRCCAGVAVFAAVFAAVRPNVAVLTLKEKNLTADGGYGYFVNRTGRLAITMGRRPVQWNEVSPWSRVNLCEQLQAVFVFTSSANV
jgi:hypothetical protein